MQKAQPLEIPSARQPLVAAETAEFTLAWTSRLASASERLELGALSASDAESLQGLTNDPAITSAVSFLSHPFSRQDAAAIIARNANGLDCFMGIRRRADGVLVGVAGAHLVGAAEVEVGYWIGSRFQRHGYATEAVSALIERLGTVWPERAVFAECRPLNAASWAVLAKLGFRATGEPGARAQRVRLSLERAAAASLS